MSREEYMRRLSGLLFHRTIQVRPTREHLERIEYAIRSMNTNPKTNVSEKTEKESFETGHRGFIVEMAVKIALGLDPTPNIRIDVKDELSYNHDVKFEGKLIEVKSITRGFERHEEISYHMQSASTLMKHKDDLGAIVFGSFRRGVDCYESDIIWIVNPEFYDTKYMYESLDGYYKFSPQRRPMLRTPNACLWNKRILTDMEFELEETT